MTHRIALTTAALRWLMLLLPLTGCGLVSLAVVQWSARFALAGGAFACMDGRAQ